MQPNDESPFALLDIQPGADGETIKQAYFKLVRAHPPEREPDTFKRIRAAYDQLRDPATRAELEMLLPIAWSPPARQRRQPALDLSLHKEDVLAAAEAFSDLDRTDWHEYYRKVKLQS
jgi:curved DNA-binding protein CbpA